MAEKTIKELADEIGVSKTAIHKKVTPDMRKSFFSKVGNKFVISEEGQEVIKSTFIIPFSETGNRKPETANLKTRETTSENTQTKPITSATKSKTTTTSTVPENNLSETAIKIIEGYQKQLEQKDLQLSELHKLLNQQQQLTLHSNQQNERLQLQLESYENMESNPSDSEIEPDQSKQKKWWKFWK